MTDLFDLTSDSLANLIRCTEVGCTAEMLSGSELARHLLTDCVVARRRRELAKRSRERELEKAKELLELLEKQRRKPAEVVEEEQRPFSGHVFNEADLRKLKNYQPLTEEDNRPRCERCNLPLTCPKERHDREMCPLRIISCPNKSFGCLERIILSDTSKHLRETCVYEKRRCVLAETSRQRNEFISCPGCNADVQIRMMKVHDTEECPHRKVSCRNAFLGCTSMIRVNERELHEEVDTAIQIPRRCLYLAGGGTNLGIQEATDLCSGGAHILLGENELVAPWTVEYWVYR
jgi:hypothetical protein